MITRLRRLRGNAILRDMVAQTRLSPDDFILPLFVDATLTGRRTVPSMPGVDRTDVDELLRDVERALDVGVRAVILFGIPDAKDEVGTGSWHDAGIVQTATRALRERFGADVYVIADVCFCEYTDHGHCGVLTPAGELDNDGTLANLAKQTLSMARAGVDMVAPSGMIDGMVATMRAALDAEGFSGVPIMSYAAKFASAFYGPFRDAADSAPSVGDRQTYQMQPGNAREAEAELALDDAEGADILMVKPAMPYLDVIATARREFRRPVAAYQVSGEYAMLHAAAANGWLDLDRVMLESLTAIRRAGADLILTYFARQAAAALAR
jgi:porphobilinogen synthase